MNQAYYNWFTGNRRQWFKSWSTWMYSRQLASGGNRNRGNGKRKGHS